MRATIRVMMSDSSMISSEADLAVEDLNIEHVARILEKPHAHRTGTEYDKVHKYMTTHIEFFQRQPKDQEMTKK